MNDQPNRLTFWFDPLCPFAWLTSLWIREVRRQRPLDVEWKFFSLAGESDDQWQGPLRICAQARVEGGNAAVDRAYLALGRLFHEQANAFERIEELAEMASPFLREVGLDPALAERALANPRTLEIVLAEHRDAAERMGTFGVPWLAVNGDEMGFFGPVIGDLPWGQDALDLWEEFSRLAQRPYLFELKRGRKSLRDLTDLSAGVEPERELAGSCRP